MTLTGHDFEVSFQLLPCFLCHLYVVREQSDVNACANALRHAKNTLHPLHTHTAQRLN